jgi:hypothetical protein
LVDGAFHACADCIAGLPLVRVLLGSDLFEKGVLLFGTDGELSSVAGRAGALVADDTRGAGIGGKPDADRRPFVVVESFGPVGAGEAARTGGPSGLPVDGEGRLAEAFASDSLLCTVRPHRADGTDTAFDRCGQHQLS